MTLCVNSLKRETSEGREILSKGNKMKKLLAVFIILGSFLIGFLCGVLMSNRYSTETIRKGFRIIKTDKLTGKIEIYDYNSTQGRYLKKTEIKN